MQKASASLMNAAGDIPSMFGTGKKELIGRQSMYGSVTRQEADAIRKLLDEKKNCLPVDTVESILWDLKFVTR